MRLKLIKAIKTSNNLTEQKIKQAMQISPRAEKIAIKDAKLRTL